MSKKSRKRPSPNPIERLIPLSADAVYAGFEKVFDDDDNKASFLEALARYKRNKHLAEFISSIGFVGVIATVMPEWEPTGELARARPSLFMSGAAIYFTCLEEEAALRHTTSPKLTMADRTFYINKRMPSESFEVPVGSVGYLAEFAKNLPGIVAEEARSFDMVETDFSTLLLEATSPEIGYTNVDRHAMVVGASVTHHLYDAHYERLELLRAVR